MSKKLKPCPNLKCRYPNSKDAIAAWNQRVDALAPGASEGQLEPADLATAIQWYRGSQAAFRALMEEHGELWDQAREKEMDQMAAALERASEAGLLEEDDERSH